MTFVLKPQAPFERLKMANDCPEVALNRGIILQAIIDASNTGGGLGSKKLLAQPTIGFLEKAKVLNKLVLMQSLNQILWLQLLSK